MGDITEYHLRELEVARDPSHPGHLMPPLKPHHKRILDIGCGMGQTLIAADLGPDVVAYGIDLDAEAIEAGRRLIPPNIPLAVGSGEKLEFPDGSFDFVICRVALPYMHIPRALAEMHRVLQPGGDVWLVLHPMEMYRARAMESLKRCHFKDVLFCGWIGVNSWLLNFTGEQLAAGNRTETFQTEGGIRKALARAGFEGIRIQRQPFFVAEAQKAP